MDLVIKHLGNFPDYSTYTWKVQAGKTENCKPFSLVRSWSILGWDKQPPG